MLVSVRIRVRPEDVRALEESAKSVTRLDLTVPTDPASCARITAAALERLGFGSAMSGSMLMAGGRSGLQKVVVRGTFVPRAGSTDVSLVGMASETVPLVVTSSILGLFLAVGTFYGCFAAKLSPAIAGLGMVLVACVGAVGFAKLLASAATKAATVLPEEFLRLRPSPGR